MSKNDAWIIEKNEFRVLSPRKGLQGKETLFLSSQAASDRCVVRGTRRCAFRCHRGEDGGPLGMVGVARPCVTTPTGRASTPSPPPPGLLPSDCRFACRRGPEGEGGRLGGGVEAHGGVEDESAKGGGEEQGGGRPAAEQLPAQPTGEWMPDGSGGGGGGSGR